MEEPGGLDDTTGEPDRYEIDRELGRGGMAQVLAARDVRLGRPVAIKSLPSHLSRDPQGIARLQREARALAKLSHPNIATIYSLEVTRGGTRLLILERVEGETLASRLRRGPMPLQETLSISGQIASALEAAHERGVIHRDLKPANVMITPKGQVKVLDFGLARITVPETGEDENVAEDLEVTSAGTVLGTVGYMSPEQARGLPADKRTDVFAFGCVLYECLAGSRAFAGNAERATAAILIREPDWAPISDETPPPIRDLLKRCLEKDRGKRLHDMSEARAVIEGVLGIWASHGPDATGGEGASIPPGPGGRGVMTNLPGPLTSFVGRTRELGEAAAFLESGRLLTFTGGGGSGKTRLAVHLGHHVLTAYTEGVWFVDLAAVVEPERVPNAVASALGLRERAGEWVVDTLAEHLAERAALLILDNCEHLLQPCNGLVQALLEHCPKIRVLATSREPLHVPGEQVFPVAPLGTRSNAQGSRKARGGEAEPSESARLFFDRAVAVKPDFDRGQPNLGLVEEICSRLEGLPLAVELAAARVRVLSVHEIRTRLRDQLRLLAGAGPSAPARHQTLAATIGWSYDLLAEEERRLFRSLSVFTGGWTLESARELMQDPGDAFDALDRLSRLVDKSLVLAETGEGDQLRFRFLETVRQFAMGRLYDAGEAERMRGRHLEVFLAFAEEAAPKLYVREQAVWFNRLEAEHENLLAALWWCRKVDGGEGKALRLAASIWRFWFGRGHFELGRSLLATILALPGAAGATPARVDALQGAGALAFHQNDFASGIASYRESLELARELGDERRMAFALGGLGNLYMGSGDYAAARSHYVEALALFRQAGDVRGAGLILSNLGRLTELEGDLETAHALFEEGMAVFREVGDIGSLALRLSSLGELSMRLGYRDRARDQLIECLHVMQELGEAHAAAYALERCAIWLEGVGDAAAATRLCGSADALRRRIAAPPSPKEKQDLDAFLLRLQGTLGGARFGDAWSQGRLIPFEKGLDEALRRLEAAA